MARGEVPVGAVVVDEHGVIIGRGYNLMESKGTQQAHAELRALAAAAKKRGGWRLDGCTLYVTLEPCAMCLGCALLSRVSTIVYGASSPQFGAVCSFEKLPEQYHAHTVIRVGLQQEACGGILKRFFVNVRTQNAKDTP
jgi:tRNA(adenine34) deaminase